MAVRKSKATWDGTLKEGSGRMNIGDDVYEGAYTFASRFEEGEGTNPEELVGAAHAGCYSMFLAAVLTNNGYNPTRVHTTATVHLGRDDNGPLITLIELNTEAEVAGIDEEAFMQYAEQSKTGCPISRALAATEISLKAHLV